MKLKIKFLIIILFLMIGIYLIMDGDNKTIENPYKNYNDEVTTSGILNFLLNMEKDLYIHYRGLINDRDLLHPYESISRQKKFRIKMLEQLMDHYEITYIANNKHLKQEGGKENNRELFLSYERINFEIYAFYSNQELPEDVAMFIKKEIQKTKQNIDYLQNKTSP